MRRRTILSCMVLAGTTLAAVPVGGTSPAGAQAFPRNVQVAGNFFGDAREEEFWYFEGPTPDALYSLDNGGTPGGPLTINGVDYNVSGNYRPVTGDFDGDVHEELLWYSPGGGADFIWHFADSVHRRQQNVAISGNYTPLAGDFNGDGIDDVFFYGSGTAPDAMWLFLRGGGHVSVPVNVNGTYRPFVASIGKDATDDLVFYAPGPTRDIVWDWTRGRRTFTQFGLTVNGTYRPFALDRFGDGKRGDDIWWFAPGAAADPFWDYQNGVRQEPPGFQMPLLRNWAVTVGDFLGDGQEDVDLIDLPGGVEVIRDHNGEGWFEYQGSVGAAGVTGSSSTGQSKGSGAASGRYTSG